MFPQFGTEYEQIVMRFIKVASTQMVSPQSVAQAKIDVWELVANRLVAQLTAYVLQHQVSSEIQKAEMKVPTSWWQMLKRDHFPKWYVNRWPVKLNTWTKEVTFTRHLNFPNSQYVYPDQLGQPIIFDRVSFDPKWNESKGECNE